ncbi:MAG: MOSC domain-containing protein [Sphingobacteriales bacterium]|nr:MAG: MOSC domain-containing protein [Sphingobacteriales bacterium]TAF82724.1 MAG: MOSC domain-containing protein [Sphingobacteriales bacterium]
MLLMNKNIAIHSINIKGEAELLVADHQSAHTAYNKQAITIGAIYLTFTGFKGDIVIDTKHHGGNDKAVCCYNADRFMHWKNTLDIDMKAGAFGENLTLLGNVALEENVYIGDRYMLGESMVEVSEPRGPCYMIGIRYNYKKFPVLCQETGYTGFYFRTIKEGWVKPSDTLVHVSAHPAMVSVMEVNYTRYHDYKNKAALQRLVNLQALTLEWRQKLKVLLNKL